MTSRVWRFGGLAVLPFVSLLVPFLMLPLIARVSNEAQFAALGVGDSLGAILALTVNFGWPLVGPARVAPLNEAEARHQLALSLVSRLTVLGIVLLPGVLLVIWLAPDGEGLLAVLAVLAGAVMGLSPAWYFIGRGDPKGLALFETVPRMSAGLLSAVILLMTGQIIWYPMAIFAGTALFQLLLLARTGVLTRLVERELWRAAPREIRRDSHAALATLAGGVYSTASVAIVAIVGSVGVVAVFSAADRLFKASLTAIVAGAASMQGWVAEDPAAIRARARRAILILGGLGVVGGTALFALGPTVMRIFFGEPYAIGYDTSAALGVAFLAVALSAGIGRLLLIPLGHVRPVTVSAIVAASVGVPAMLIGTLVWGVPGAAAGFALSELVAAMIQAGAAWMSRDRIGRP